MTVNRTTLLDLPIITTGTESGAWGNITNNGLSQYMDIAIAGMTSLTSANFTAGALTIANTQGDSSATNIAAGSAQYATIKVSSLAANSTITAPSSNRAYRIINADGTYTLTIKASGQTGVTFPINTSGIVVFNGTDYVLLGSYVIASAGTASLPSITTTGDTNTGIYFPAADTIAFTEGGAESMRIDSSGNLGIGTSSPSAIASGYATVHVASTNGGGIKFGTTSSLNIGYAAGSAAGVEIGTQTNLPLTFFTNNSTKATLDSSGNLGLGVTPSAWGSSNIASQIGPRMSLWSAGSSTIISNNQYRNSANARIYLQSGYAAEYQQDAGNGSHVWFTAPTGTAGNAITFTQAMTLGSNGNLAVGTTDTSQYRILAQQSAADNLGIGNLASNGTSIIRMLHNGTVGAINVSYTGGGSYSPLAFFTSDTERARITSGGYFKASNTGTYIGSGSSFHETVSDATTDGVLIVESTSASYASYILSPVSNRNTTNNSYYAIGYYHRGAGAYKFLVADSGNVTNTNGSYGTISDAKMKTDIVDAGSQWADIKAVRFRKFKMKDDPEQIVQLGVVAQELEQTSPGLVDEHTDRDQEGNDLGTTTKSVKTSVLLMKAAVALQEAMARIETLEAKVAQLEGA